MHISSDADKSVCQSAGAALLLWLRGDVVAEHSLHVETQQDTYETARLTLLSERCKRVRLQHYSFTM